MAARIPQRSPLLRLGAAAAVACLAVASGPFLHAQAIQRSMYVSVVNERGAPVPDLGTADFIVREDNVAREVLRVAPALDPMQIALLVDNSAATRNYVLDIRQGLHAFVKAMMTPDASTGRNQMALIALADRPTILVDYTTSADSLQKGVDRVFSQPDSGTLLLEGIIEICRGFKVREAARPVIVAVTTEGPEFSDRYYDLVLGPLKDSDAAFHALVVGPPAVDASDATRNRGVVLDQGTRLSGGRRENILSSMSLPGKLQELAEELKHQYLVTYARPQSLIPPERITVAAARTGLTARGTPVKEARTGPLP